MLEGVDHLEADLLLHVLEAGYVVEARRGLLDGDEPGLVVLARPFRGPGVGVLDLGRQALLRALAPVGDRARAGLCVLGDRLDAREDLVCELEAVLLHGALRAVRELHEEVDRLDEVLPQGREVPFLVGGLGRLEVALVLLLVELHAA